MPDRLPCFHIAEPLQGFNLSKQYIGRYAYHSQVTGQDEFIKVEIGLREPLFDPIESRLARTMLIDPFRNLPALVSVAVNVMSLRETYAEKFRAALTRKEPAIRDFYDIAYAIRTRRLNLNDTRLVTLIREKLTVSDTTPVDISEAKLSVLRRQLEPQLQPDLRGPDYENFDLEHAFGIVVQLAKISLHAIPQKSPCQPNLLECSRLGTRFQVPILYALTLLARVSQVETLCPHRVSFALLRLHL